MKNIIIIFISILLCVNLQAQIELEKGQFILNTNITGLLEEEQTAWLGMELFVAPNSSISFDAGYIMDQGWNQWDVLPLEKSKTNLKFDAAFKRYIGKNKHYYHAINIGFKSLNFEGTPSIVTEWDIIEMDSTTGYSAPSFEYEGKIYTPTQEDVFQEVHQTQWTFQYMGGYTHRFNRFCIDLFYRIGVENISNNMTVGYRSLPYPWINILPNENNGLENYTQADVDLGLRIGFLLN